MRKINAVDFGDLLGHAESLGFPWNYAHEMLDDYYPNTDMGPPTIYLSELCNPWGNDRELEYKRDWLIEDNKKYWVNQATRDILIDFMQVNEVTEITVVD